MPRTFYYYYYYIIIIMRENAHMMPVTILKAQSTLWKITGTFTTTQSQWCNVSKQDDKRMIRTHNNGSSQAVLRWGGVVVLRQTCYVNVNVNVNQKLLAWLKYQNYCIDHEGVLWSRTMSGKDWRKRNVLRRWRWRCYVHVAIALDSQQEICCGKPQATFPCLMASVITHLIL